jgi:excisionase family DNA binding protein
MTPVLELLTAWYPEAWKDPVLLVQKELSLSASGKVKEYMTSEEAAAYLKVHPQTLRKWVRLGVFPRIPLPGEGKDFRFSKKAIDAWAEARILGDKRPKPR